MPPGCDPPRPPVREMGPARYVRRTTDRKQSVATIHAALDAGINFFDTAPAYGRGESEELLGKALADVRGHIVLATKVSSGQLAAGKVVESCEQSLRLLR